MDWKGVLERVRDGELSVAQALEQLSDPKGFLQVGSASLDTQRTWRQKIPEVIFASGKSPEQVAELMSTMREHDSLAIATRADSEHSVSVREQLPEVEYDPTARILWCGTPQPDLGLNICVVSAGTSDEPVAAEATRTATLTGFRARQIRDVGVAGVHRLIHHLDEIRAADIVIVVAGMDGALPSLIGGLVATPVIAVPTSQGYGANFQGIAPLLTMLNSCSPGLAVVNIDNGFGAAVLAKRIGCML